MTTVNNVIVHTRHILSKNILESCAQVIFFAFFPVSPPIGQHRHIMYCTATTHVYSHDLTTFHEIISSKLHTRVRASVRRRIPYYYYHYFRSRSFFLSRFPDSVVHFVDACPWWRCRSPLYCHLLLLLMYNIGIHIDLSICFHWFRISIR